MDDEIINQEETPEEIYTREIQDKYQAIFSNTLGQSVLKDILMTCHFGVTLDPDNKIQIAEYNVGMVIAAKAGLLRKISELFGV